MAQPEGEARVNELKLQLSQERASWGHLCDDPAASSEDLAQLASRIQNLEAQLVILGADLHTPPADPVAKTPLPGPSALERVLALLPQLSGEDLQRVKKVLDELTHDPIR